MTIAFLFAACSSTPGTAVARQQIDSAAVEIWDAVARSDSATVLRHHAEDAILMGSGAPMVKGKPAVATFLDDLFKQNTFKTAKGRVTDVTVSGDLAVETGTYEMTIVPKNGPAISDRGKYIHVWRRGPDGAWKVTRYIANSDVGAQ
jgi:ketosteroid isomerase-like protein